MRVHSLQHVPFEGLGSIAAWAERRGHLVSCTRLYAGEALPAQEEFEYSIILPDAERGGEIAGERSGLRIHVLQYSLAEVI
jgi:hypothetical protein